MVLRLLIYSLPVPELSVLFTQTEFANGFFVLLGIDLLKVGQKAPPLPDHEQKPAAGMVILLVDLEMIVKIVDPLRKKRNLDGG
jgi:hypothetical protein